MITLKNWQSEAIKAWINNNCSGVIEAPTGSGKSFIGLKAIKVLNNIRYKIIIIVPTTVLQEQWVKMIKDKLGLNAGRIGNNHNEKSHIVVAIINSARNIDLNEYDILIADEVHHLFSPENIKILKNNKFKAILGLSATVHREDNRESLFNLPITYKYTHKSALQNKEIAQYKIIDTAVELSLSAREAYNYYTKFITENYYKYGKEVYSFNKTYDATLTKLRRFINKRKLLLLNNPQKVQETLKLCLDNKDKKIIIFCERTNMAEFISKVLKINDIENRTYTLKNKDKNIIEDFTNNKYNILIAVRCLDEGLNVQNVNMIIIVAGSSVKRQQIQRIGRALRYEENKESIIYNLYTKNTVEEKWLKKRMI